MNGGRAAFVARRISGVLLTIYLAVYCITALRHGGLVFLGDLGRLGPAWWVLELVAIAILCFHTFDGIAQSVIEARSWARHHRRVIVVVLVLTVVVTALHIPVLMGGLS